MIIINCESIPWKIPESYACMHQSIIIIIIIIIIIADPSGKRKRE